MPVYDIYALGESNISLSGGAILDGVTQGDGSHLVPDPPTPPITITIDTPNWEAVSIDDDDPNFQDSDGSQTLNGTQTFDGIEYTGNPRVEAEYSFTVTDGTNTWTLIAFNINNSSPAYGTVEGIAVIGGPGSFPPPGIPLTITSAAEGPIFDATEYASPVCLVEGTRVLCAQGEERPVEDIQVGDVVETAKHGLQVVRWIGRQHVPAVGKMAPVTFDSGVLGNRRPLKVSQQHRVLLQGWHAQIWLGQDEALVAAGHLVNGRNVRITNGGMVRYFHLLLDVHALLWCDGALCESLYPGEMALRSVGPEVADEIRRLLPQQEPKFAAPLTPGREAQGLATRL